MKTRAYVLLLLTGCLLSCQNGQKFGHQELPYQKGPIRITGAYALLPMMNKWVSEYKKLHPSVDFEITATGSGKALNIIQGGRTDIGMISSAIPNGPDSLLWIFPVVKLGVVPVTSSQNPYLPKIKDKGIKRDFLESVFSGKSKPTWGDIFGTPGKDAIIPMVRSDSSGATDVFAQYLWLEPSAMRGQACNGEPAMINAVKSNPLSLGYINFIYAIKPSNLEFVDSLSIIPLDFNYNGAIDGHEKIFNNAKELQRAMWLGKFPCSLVRTLYVVTRGKPATKELTEFLYWIITDGQKFVAPEGYIELHSSEVQYLVNAMSM